MDIKHELLPRQSMMPSFFYNLHDSPCDTSCLSRDIPRADYMSLYSRVGLTEAYYVKLCFVYKNFNFNTLFLFDVLRI